MSVVQVKGRIYSVYNLSARLGGEMKIIKISKCEDCPYCGNGPREDIEFWGKKVCTLDPSDLIVLKDILEIPEWCVLEDA